MIDQNYTDKNNEANAVGYRFLTISLNTTEILLGQRLKTKTQMQLTSSTYIFPLVVGDDDKNQPHSVICYKYEWSEPVYSIAYSLNKNHAAKEMTT